jgi:three-Cys-motif partner protein
VLRSTTTAQNETIERLKSLFDGKSIRFTLIGSAACREYGLSRPARDLDFVVGGYVNATGLLAGTREYKPILGSADPTGRTCTQRDLRTGVDVDFLSEGIRINDRVWLGYTFYSDPMPIPSATGFADVASLVTLFNDRDARNVGKLREAIDALPGIETLKHKPQISNDVVGEEIAKKFAAINLVPTFFFVDPWGYKGLSLGLINSVLQNWGCDCVFFFNYNRVNMGLNNVAVKEHMDALFGTQRADLLRARLSGLGPEDREMLIVEELSQALKEMGAAFVLPFTFKNERSDRTTHHLIFATKHFKGYEIMKGIRLRRVRSTSKACLALNTLLLPRIIQCCLNSPDRWRIWHPCC